MLIDVDKLRAIGVTVHILDEMGEEKKYVKGYKVQVFHAQGQFPQAIADAIHDRLSSEAFASGLISETVQKLEMLQLLESISTTSQDVR
jgi:hypothetical protein